MKRIDTPGRPLYLQRVGKLVVVRDDLVPGGTKARVLPVLFDHHVEYVYASPVQGYAQVALGHCCREYGKVATVFCAERAKKHPLTIEAIAASVNIVEVGPPAFLTVVQKRATDYAALANAKLLPFGLHTPELIAALADIARCIDEPPEFWSVASSGTLTMALQAAWPNAVAHAVRTGAARDIGRAKLWVAPEKYEQSARRPPPWPSCTNYDAKIWQFARQHARDGALIWNVAG